MRELDRGTNIRDQVLLVCVTWISYATLVGERECLTVANLVIAGLVHDPQ